MFDYGRALIWSARLGSVYIEDRVETNTIPHTRTARGKDRPTLPDVLCGVAQSGIQTLKIFMCHAKHPHTRFYMCVCVYTYLFFTTP